MVDLRLEHRKIKIQDIKFGDRSEIQEGILFINKDEIIDTLKEDTKIKEVKIDLAKPGKK